MSNTIPEKKLTAAELAKGTIKLVKPIRAQSTDVTELEYDFGELTGMDYVEAMGEDAPNHNAFRVSAKQALALFATAAAKCTPKVDAIDIRERIGAVDAMKAVQAATLFLVVSAREESATISAE